MVVPNAAAAARASEVDPVAEALASAPNDDHEVTPDEIEALQEARADKRPLVAGAAVTESIARRSRNEG